MPTNGRKLRYWLIETEAASITGPQKSMLVAMAMRRKNGRSLLTRQMTLNDAGRMVLDAWRELPARFPNLKIDEVVRVT